MDSKARDTRENPEWENRDQIRLILENPDFALDIDQIESILSELHAIWTDQVIDEAIAYYGIDQCQV